MSDKNTLNKYSFNTDWLSKITALQPKVEVLCSLLNAEAVSYLKINGDEVPWGIACSGGADSTMLILLLILLFPKNKRNFLILHYNHKLRGKDSDIDAEFVKEIANQLDIAYVLGEATERPLISNLNYSEEELREERHAFFKHQLAHCNSRILITGHQLDDVVEMMLMRLSRGSGLEGLIAPKPVQRAEEGRMHIRPLLSLSREWIQNCLKEHGIPWRPDASNQSSHYFRNRIRNNVIPAWIQSLPSGSHYNLYETIAATRELLEEENTALEQWVEEVWPALQLADNLTVLASHKDDLGESVLNIMPLKGKPKALYRRILHRWLNSLWQGKSLGKKMFDCLLEACIRNKPLQLSFGRQEQIKYQEGKLFYKNEEKLAQEWIWRKEEEAHLQVRVGSPEGSVILHMPEGKALEAVIVQMDEELRQFISSGQITCDKQVFLAIDILLLAILDVLGFEKKQERKLNSEISKKILLSDLSDSSAKILPCIPLIIRGWQVGDRYCPLGAQGQKKLQDQFINKKIKNLHRHQLPVILLGNDKTPAWVPGLPPSEEYKVLESTFYALRLTYGNI